MAFSSSDCPPTAVECPQGAAMTHPESTPKLNDDSNSVEASATGDTLPKKLRWFDGFAMSMTMPAALLGRLGGGGILGHLNDPRAGSELALHRTGSDVPHLIGRDRTLCSAGMEEQGTLGRTACGDRLLVSVGTQPGHLWCDNGRIDPSTVVSRADVGGAAWPGQYHASARHWARCYRASLRDQCRRCAGHDGLCVRDGGHPHDPARRIHYFSALQQRVGTT